MIERVIDKLIAKSNGLLSGGSLFAMLGVGNLIGYGLSYWMEPANYDFHFLYSKNDKRLSKPLMSMLGSTNWLNTAWASSGLIFGGLWLQKMIGPVACTKYFFFSLLSSYVFMTALGPNSYFSEGFTYRHLIPSFLRCDSYRPDGSQMVPN